MNKTDKPDAPTVSDHVMEVNSVLVKNLVERFSEALYKINLTLEAGTSLDESTLERLRTIIDNLEDIKEDAESILTSSVGVHDIVNKIHSGLVPFFADRPYHSEDRVSLVAFVRRVSSTVSNWSDADKALVLDSLEKAPSMLSAARRKVKRLYILLAGAGIVAILSSVGAPEWLKKLMSLLFGS